MQTSSCCKSNFCRIQSATLHSIQMSRRDGLCHDSSHLQTCKLPVQQQVRHEWEFNLTIQMAWATKNLCTHHDFIHRALVALYICNSCPWNVTWSILTVTTSWLCPPLPSKEVKCLLVTFYAWKCEHTCKTILPSPGLLLSNPTNLTLVGLHPASMNWLNRLWKRYFIINHSWGKILQECTRVSGLCGQSSFLLRQIFNIAKQW